MKEKTYKQEIILLIIDKLLIGIFIAIVGFWLNSTLENQKKDIQKELQNVKYHQDSTTESTREVSNLQTQEIRRLGDLQLENKKFELGFQNVIDQKRMEKLSECWEALYSLERECVVAIDSVWGIQNGVNKYKQGPLFTLKDYCAMQMSGESEIRLNKNTRLNIDSLISHLAKSEFYVTLTERAIKRMLPYVSYADSICTNNRFWINDKDFYEIGRFLLFIRLETEFLSKQNPIQAYKIHEERKDAGKQIKYFREKLVR